MINGINSREMILEILLEIEEGEHSHVAIRNALSKYQLSLIHISEPTRQAEISYAVFCLKKKKKK